MVMGLVAGEFPDGFDDGTGDGGGHGLFGGLVDSFGVPMTIFFAVFAVFFLLVLGLILRVVLRGLREWSRNNASPVTTVPAVIVAKRQDFRGGGERSVSTWHYVTFEVQGGDRMEVPVSERDYGLLVERDRGELTHQGTRFKAFARAPQDR